MHPDLSAPAAKDRRERLTAAAEQDRVLRTIDRKHHWGASALAVQIVSRLWWRPTKNHRCATLEQCTAKLAGQLE